MDSEMFASKMSEIRQGLQGLLGSLDSEPKPERVRRMDMKAWDASGDMTTVVFGNKCYGGLATDSTEWLTALVVICPTPFGVAVKPRFWLPEVRVLYFGKTLRLPMAEWIEERVVDITPGETVDVGFIRGFVTRACAFYREMPLGYNPGGILGMVSGVPDSQKVSTPLTCINLAPPLKELERLVLAKELLHGGNPLLRWEATNLRVVEDAAGNYKPARTWPSPSRSLPGMMALIMALKMFLDDDDSS